MSKIILEMSKCSKLVSLGLAVIALLILASIVFSEDLSFAHKTKLEYVAENIPKVFKKIRTDTYLIKFVPEAKKGYGKGGQLTVYLPPGSSLVSIFDRTDANPLLWYNVSWNRGNNWGIYLIKIKEENLLHPADAKKRFNSLIYFIYQEIKNRKN